MNQEYAQFNFFSTIFKYADEGQIEFRQIPSKSRSFHNIKDVASLELTDSENVYFTPATRNGGGRKEQIVQIPCIWCDIDFKNTPEKKAKKLIKEYPLQPTAIINSGGGFHLYWLLKESLEKSDIPEVESYLKRLANYFGGDRGCTDASHIMRVPGTLNHKYDPPRKAELLQLERSLEYELSDFDQCLPDLKDSVLKKQNREMEPNSRLSSIEDFPVSASIKCHIKNGVPKGQRSEIIASVLSALIRAGVSDGIIFQIFNSYPIGEKYQEKGQGKDKWLQDEINRAKAFNNKNNQKNREDLFCLN